MTFDEFLESIGFFTKIAGYWSHTKGYSLVVAGKDVIIKDNLDFDLLYKGDLSGAREWLSEVFDV